MFRPLTHRDVEVGSPSPIARPTSRGAPVVQGDPEELLPDTVRRSPWPLRGPDNLPLGLFGVITRGYPQRDQKALATPLTGIYSHNWFALADLRHSYRI